MFVLSDLRPYWDADFAMASGEMSPDAFTAFLANPSQVALEQRHAGRLTVDAAPVSVFEPWLCENAGSSGTARMVFFQSIENGRHLRTLITSMAVQKNLLLAVLRAATFSHDQDPNRSSAASVRLRR
jgi:hypothetical protein